MGFRFVFGNTNPCWFNAYMCLCKWVVDLDLKPSFVNAWEWFTQKSLESFSRLVPFPIDSESFKYQENVKPRNRCLDATKMIYSNINLLLLLSHFDTLLSMVPWMFLSSLALGNMFFLTPNSTFHPHRKTDLKTYILQINFLGKLILELWNAYRLPSMTSKLHQKLNLSIHNINFCFNWFLVRERNEVYAHIFECFSLQSLGSLWSVWIWQYNFPYWSNTAPAGISSSRTVTLGSIEIFNTHEWLPSKPTVYFKCQGGNKTVLPDVKEKHALYTFKGEESWQVCISARCSTFFIQFGTVETCLGNFVCTTIVTIIIIIITIIISSFFSSSSSSFV